MMARTKQTTTKAAKPKLTPAQVILNFEVFAPTFLRIIDNHSQLVPFRLNSIQRQFLRDKTGRDVVVKPRQIGMSTFACAERYWIDITQYNTRTATIAQDDTTTQHLRRMTKLFHQMMPAGLKPLTQYDNASVSTYPETHSTASVFTAGSRAAGRGGSYSHIHASEVAFWPDAESIMAGLMQGGSARHLRVLLESTANGAQGYFYNLVMELIGGRKDFKLHFYAWWQDSEKYIPLEPGETLDYTGDELRLIELHGLRPEQIKFRRAKQQELKHLFDQEYAEDIHTCFLQSGLGYFGDLAHCYTPYTNDAGQTLECYAGLDFGQSNDYTVLSIFDRVTKQQVDLLRINRMSWGEMRSQIIAKLKAWGVRVLVYESNSIGGVNAEELMKEAAAAGLRTSLQAFLTTNISKAGIMSFARDCLHEGGYKLLPIPEQKSEMQAFIAKQTALGTWTYSAPDNQHDDIVIANALAIHAMGRTPNWEGFAG